MILDLIILGAAVFGVLAFFSRGKLFNNVKNRVSYAADKAAKAAADPQANLSAAIKTAEDRLAALRQKRRDLYTVNEGIGRQLVTCEKILADQEKICASLGERGLQDRLQTAVRAKLGTEATLKVLKGQAEENIRDDNKLKLRIEELTAEVENAKIAMKTGEVQIALATVRRKTAEDIESGDDVASLTAAMNESIASAEDQANAYDYVAKDDTAGEDAVISDEVKAEMDKYTPKAN